MIKNRKKTMTFVMLISAIFVIIGIIITSIGITQGGVIYVKSVRFGPISTVAWSDGSNIESLKTYTSKNEIKSISIDADLGDVYVEEAEKFSIKVENFDKNSISFKDNNGNISLSSGNNEIIMLPFSFWGGEKYNRKITVYVPKSCSSLDVNADLGNVKINNISIEHITLSLDLGNLEANNITVNSGKLDLNLGNASFFGDFTKKLIIRNDLGNVDITLNKSIDDYGYDLKTDLGSIDLNGERYHSHRENKDNKPLLKADVNLGEININFNK